MRTKPGHGMTASGTRQTAGRGVARFRAALAAAQIALSMALLAMTAVFAQNLGNIARIDLGLNVESVVTFSIFPQTSAYTPDASASLFERLERSLAGIPGVTSAASAMIPLLSGGGFGLAGFFVDGVEVKQPISQNSVSPGFFRTLGIGLRTGRDFADTDTGNAPLVAIVNQRFVDVFGLGQDPLGPRLKLRADGAPVEIVAVIANAKAGEVTGEVGPQLFLPRRQDPRGPSMLGSATFYVRGNRPPDDLMKAVRTTVADADPNMAIASLRTMEQQVRENLATERFFAGASISFAVLATLLAALGLYGVLAYSVAQRSREIGLRFALGAPAGRIRGMVLRQVAIIVLIGAIVGTGATWLLGRAARSLLFGMNGPSVSAIAAAAAVLAAVAITSTYIPVRRASRVDPMAVLRDE
jgi:predicted permease